jgi:uracil-DNA glycosylase
MSQYPRPLVLEPSPDCRLCPRLGAFRDGNRAQYPDFHNAPVPSFGGRDARLLIVGIAPGVKGANQTGRPFTGDYAGDLL